MFDTQDLTCFQFGGSYLMVEREDEVIQETGHSSYSTCLRLNVPDVRVYADKLTTQGINVSDTAAARATSTSGNKHRQ